MFAWLNLVVLLVATALVPYFYIKSAQPAALAQRIGDQAYAECARYRLMSTVAMTVTVISYIVYLFYPLPLPLPAHFPWPWAVSGVIGLVILIPALYLLIRGSMDAGEETMRPRPEHTMYGGIYEKMRHPQAAGESVTWLGAAFLLHSPLLALYSLIWLPIYYWMCRAEEKDLLLRYGQAYRAYMDRTGFLFPKRSSKETGS